MMTTIAIREPSRSCPAADDQSRGIGLRSGAPDDAGPAGAICYEAFKTIAERHGFAPDFPSSDIATDLISHLLSRSDIHAIIAERDGRVMGSNFLWEGDAVAGVGPITVDPNAQNSKIGRALMNDVLRHGDGRGTVSIRLVQAAYHNRSLSLYTKLGFDTVEPLSNIQGESIQIAIEGYVIRAMTSEDLAAVDAL